ncbi:MAG: hypothetical protein L7S55_08880 [Luminiphilus sp.]|nr:hypothetical protein [Luminiphilus sp.]
MIEQDYANLFNAYCEYAVNSDEKHDVSPPGKVATNFLSGGTAEEIAVLAEAYWGEMENNHKGMTRLRDSMAHTNRYVLVAKLSTQVIVKDYKGNTQATIVDANHRAGLLRWAAENNLLAYGSEFSDAQGSGDNVITVAF